MGKDNIKVGEILRALQSLGYTQKDIRNIFGIAERTQRRWKKENKKLNEVSKYYQEQLQKPFKILSKNVSRETVKKFERKPVTHRWKTKISGKKYFTTVIKGLKINIYKFGYDDLEKYHRRIKQRKRFLYIVLEIGIYKNKRKIGTQEITSVNSNFNDLDILSDDLLEKIERIFGVKPGFVGEVKKYIDGITSKDNLNFKVEKIIFHNWDFK